MPTTLLTYAVHASLLAAVGSSFQIQLYGSRRAQIRSKIQHIYVFIIVNTYPETATIADSNDLVPLAGLVGVLDNYGL